MTVILAASFFEDTLKPIAEIITAAVATGGFIWGFYLYREQNLEKRAERFSATRARLNKEESFRTMKGLIEAEDRSLRDLAFSQKLDYICFFEEIALLVNTGLLNKSVVHYMLGYYIVKCWRSEAFWHGINRSDPWWSLFKAFAEQMEALGDKEKFNYNAAFLRL